MTSSCPQCGLRSISITPGCDLVGFHIEDYCRNFLDCCHRRLGCRVDRVHNLVDVAGRTVKVRALPIGIPYKRFEEMANAAPRALQSSQEIILGVDRLDYTKGLVNRYWVCLSILMIWNLSSSWLEYRRFFQLQPDGERWEQPCPQMHGLKKLCTRVSSETKDPKRTKYVAY